MARKSRNSPPAIEPVAWRDGVHVTGSAIWCDARRARDLCFVSAPDRVGRAGHGQLIATAATLAQLGAAPGPHLSAPYRRPFTLGTLRLELMPSGHALGGAALLVDAGERRTLVCGVMGGASLGEPAEVRRADVMVIDARYGSERHVFAPDAAERAIADITRAGMVAVLVTSAHKGLDVAARLVDAGLDVTAHRSIHHAARRLTAAGIAAPTMRRAGAARGGVILWPVRDRARLPKTERVILVSGLATEPETVAALGADAAYPWSNAADRATLLALIGAVGAQRVYLTGRAAEDVAAALGPQARVLAPPRQMPLFAEAAG